MPPKQPTMAKRFIMFCHSYDYFDKLRQPASGVFHQNKIQLNISYNQFSKYLKLIFFISYCFYFLTTHAQIDATTSFTATELAEYIAGNGIEVSSAVLSCHNQGKGKFDCIDCNVGIDSGVVLTSGKAVFVEGPNNTGSKGFVTSFSGDPDLNDLPGISSTQDGCVLEFDLVPIADTIVFNYVFGSEEYLEFAGSSYNDVFGFFISGPGITGTKNIALIPGSSIPVSINSVNNSVNAVYYNPNGTGTSSPYDSDDFYIQYDGFTDVFQAISEVTPCETYHLKLAVADVGDGSYDSGVFLQANSLNSTLSFTADSLVVSSGDTAYVTSGVPVDLVAYGPTGYTYTWSPPGGLSTTSGSSTTATVTTTTTYTVTLSDCGTITATVTLIPETVLPATVTYFNATCTNESVLVEWNTLTEINTKEFIIERSSTGNQFEEIAHVPANENSNTEIHYTWTENAVHTSTKYYKLKLIDLNNTISYYSQTLAVLCNPASVFSIESIYFSENVLHAHVQYPADEICFLTIYDVLGRKITEHRLQLYQGSNHIQIAAGEIFTEQMYFAALSSRSGIVLQTEKVLKAK